MDDSSETTQPAWPKLPSGVYDWEQVFEHAEQGLIPRISQVRSVPALRTSALLIIKRLYRGKGEALEAKRLIAEIEKITINPAVEDDLPELIHQVTVLLRTIKIHHIAKAQAYERSLAAAAKKKEDGEAETDVRPEPSPAPFEDDTPRHEPGQPPDKIDPFQTFQPRTKLNPTVKISAISAAVLVIVVGFGLSIFTASEKMPLTPTQTLVQQMSEAAEAKPIETHVFGGRIAMGEQNGHGFVSANGIPPDICPDAAWALANRGSVMINQIMPGKISPGVLNSLCARSNSAASITWFPRSLRKAKTE